MTLSMAVSSELHIHAPLVLILPVRLLRGKDKRMIAVFHRGHVPAEVDQNNDYGKIGNVCMLAYDGGVFGVTNIGYAVLIVGLLCELVLIAWTLFVPPRTLPIVLERLQDIPC